MSGHTPGPWSTAAKGSGVLTKDDSMWFTQRWTGCRDPEELAANARLIAAAPQLLEALQFMEFVLEATETQLRTFGVEPVANTEGAFERSRPAIAKATGKDND